MKLVIAEKPSVALSIAKVLGASKMHDGYLDGGGYVVSWCFGHLLAFADPGLYDETLKAWSYDTLPIIPDKWLFSVERDKKKQLNEVVSDSFSSEAFEGDERYNNILNITENGQIGTINIPSIDCRLPIYHGSSEDMLSKGAVHLAGTAFPIGGSSTRSVISAHTAFPGKIFFDRLSEVEIGETFSVTVLGDTFYYKVTEINIVLPDEVEYLQPVKDKDLITLVTCTPYALNTHRLLVTGERDMTSKAELSEPETVQRKPVDLGLSVALIALVIITGSILIKRVIRKKRKMKHEK